MIMAPVDFDIQTVKTLSREDRVQIARASVIERIAVRLCTISFRVLTNRGVIAI